MTLPAFGLAAGVTLLPVAVAFFVPGRVPGGPACAWLSTLDLLASLLHLPLLVLLPAGLVFVGKTVPHGHRRALWLPSLVLLSVAGICFGNCLTIAVIHSPVQHRYTLNLFLYPAFYEVAAVAWLAEAFLGRRQHAPTARAAGLATIPFADLTEQEGCPEPSRLSAPQKRPPPGGWVLSPSFLLLTGWNTAGPKAAVGGRLSTKLAAVSPLSTQGCPNPLLLPATPVAARRFRVRPARGFTLIETAIASALITLFLSSLFLLNTTVLRMLRSGNETATASQVLQARAEKIRMATWLDATSPTYLPGNLLPDQPPTAINLAALTETIFVGVYNPGGATMSPSYIYQRTPDGKITSVSGGSGASLAGSDCIQFVVTEKWSSWGGRSRERTLTTLASTWGVGQQ